MVRNVELSVGENKGQWIRLEPGHGLAIEREWNIKKKVFVYKINVMTHQLYALQPN